MATPITKLWNTDENYWTLNPIMKTIKAFKDFHDSDKSKGKEKSSKIMWAIALYVDPNDHNPWRNTSDNDKKVLIAEDFLGDKKFNWNSEGIVELVETYENHCLTKGEKELVRFERKLEQRGDFIDATPYSLDSYDEETSRIVKGTADQLDKMVLGTIKIYEQYELIKAMIGKEDASHVKGGAKESASESKLM